MRNSFKQYYAIEIKRLFCKLAFPPDLNWYHHSAVKFKPEGVMVCPECGSTAIGKEVTRRGWSGDYVCHQCGCNNAKDAFESENKSKEKAPTLKLKKKASPI
ncbi:hypothetical protein OUHCRE15_11970 [Enterobacter hormaechei subsp. xiangfangensis]|nr:MAG TPA: DNA-directed RNA polymerase II subunit [Caudoviricetes sp.]